MDIPVEWVLDREGVDYKIRPGTRGVQLNVKTCPVCGATGWKVYLSRERSVGNCFRCDVRFSTFSFTRALLGLSNAATYDYLRSFNAGYLGYESPRAEAVDLEIDMALPSSVPIPYQGANLVYLERRGILAETAFSFGVRYCFEDQFVYRYGDQVTAVDMSERLIFPVLDLSGRLVTFQARDTTDRRQPKYWFPPGYSVSGRVLYNAHNAVGAQSVVIGEGVFDVLALHQALKQAERVREVVPVATFGKHLGSGSANDDQLSVLNRLRRYGLDRVYLCWDGTLDAMSAAVGVLRELHRQGFDALFVRLPDGCDPNEISAERLLHCIDRAERYTPALEAKVKLGRL